MKKLIRQEKNNFIVTQVKDSYILKPNETFDDNPFDIGGKIENSVWVETATQVEIDNFNKNKKEKQYIEIDKKINGLIAGSIAIILKIKGLEDKELQARKELYENLYNACKDETGSSDDIIEIKRQLFNLENSSELNLQEYKDLVITKWELGLKALESFKLMIEAVRSKWKLSVNDLNKYNNIEDKINSLSEETDPTIIPTIFQEIINL